MFSSLSESGFIPTYEQEVYNQQHRVTVLISFREWLHSYLWDLEVNDLTLILRFSSLSESGFIPTNKRNNSFTGKVRSLFSSLSESGFIPTFLWDLDEDQVVLMFSSLSESGFIPTYLKYHVITGRVEQFSSLSESGFIPTL